MRASTLSKTGTFFSTRSTASSRRTTPTTAGRGNSTEPSAWSTFRPNLAIQAAEALPPPAIESMFRDVYKDMPRHIEEQMRYAIAMGEGTKFEGAFPL